MFKIGVDIGHGTNTAGKRTNINGVVSKEYTINKSVALMLAHFINSNHLLEYVTQLRSDMDVMLLDRVAYYNSRDVDLVISIHNNAHGDGTAYTSASGTETLYTSGFGSKLATCIQNNIIEINPLRDRGKKYRDDLTILKHTKAVAVLVECSFFTNKSDVAYMDTNGCYYMAFGIYKGILEYFDIATPTEPKPTIVDEEYRYKTVEELPLWSTEYIERCIEKGVLVGEDDGLHLSYDMVRIYTSIGRLLKP